MPHQLSRAASWPAGAATYYPEINEAGQSCLPPSPVQSIAKVHAGGGVLENQRKISLCEGGAINHVQIWRNLLRLTVFEKIKAVFSVVDHVEGEIAKYYRHQRDVYEAWEIRGKQWFSGEHLEDLNNNPVFTSGIGFA